MCIFVVLSVEETLFYMCEYSDAIKLPKYYPPPPKKNPIEYYDNTKYSLKKGENNPHNCHVFKFFT